MRRFQVLLGGACAAERFHAALKKEVFIKSRQKD